MATNDDDKVKPQEGAPKDKEPELPDFEGSLDLAGQDFEIYKYKDGTYEIQDDEGNVLQKFQPDPKLSAGPFTRAKKWLEGTSAYKKAYESESKDFFGNKSAENRAEFLNEVAEAFGSEGDIASANQDLDLKPGQTAFDAALGVLPKSQRTVGKTAERYQRSPDWT